MSLQELVGFLDSPQPEVVKIAVENLLPATMADSGKSFVFTEHDFKGARALKKLSLHSSDPWAVQSSIIALINLTDNKDIRADLASDSSAVTGYAKLAASSTTLPYTRYVCMLLSNLSRESDAIKTLRGPLLAALILTTAKPANVAREEYDFLSFVFGEFARQDPAAIAKLIPHLFGQLSSGSLNRRRGVAAAMKNTLFESSVHEPLANDTPLIETILVCLLGPEPMDSEDAEKLPPLVRNLMSPSKEREADTDVQTTLVECLLLLSSSQPGREALRNKGAYYIIRELHKVTEDPNLRQLCENFVNMTMRGDPNQADEPRIQEVDASNGDEDVGITEVV